MTKRTFTLLTGLLLGIACSELRAQEAAESVSSISPDGRWEFTCRPFGGLGQCAPVILKAATDEQEVYLDDELKIHGPDAKETEVVWAPDSKRFACNFSPAHPHSTTYVEVAFYQLKGDEWVRLKSPAEEGVSRLQLTQLGKGRLSKDFNPARCQGNQDELKVTRWVDRSQAIVYAPCYQSADGEKKTGFLFTLKFDEAGKWRVAAMHRMSKKELAETQR